MTGAKKIVIIGGAGFIGSKLAEALLALDYSVTIIDRVTPKTEITGAYYLVWDVGTEKLHTAHLEGAYGVVNLAGTTIGKRWSKSYKRKIYKSRIDTTHNLVEAIEKTEVKPKVLVSASAVGYYGDKGQQLITEEAPAGSGFLGQLCVDWEGEAMAASYWGVRVVVLRTANVLGEGGLLAALKPFFKMGFGGYFGSGEQRMPWVHWRDIVGIYIFALEHTVEGAFNTGAGTAPTQKELFSAFGKKIHAPIVWKIPHFLAHIALGSFASELTFSQNTSSEKIEKAGYKYVFDDLAIALNDIYNNIQVK